MKVMAVVLAAGRGRRMGGAKHLLELEGQPLLERVVESLSQSSAAGVLAVLRPGDQSGATLLERLRCRYVFAESADEGRSASVRAAVRAAPRDHALLFALADQPWLEPRDFDALIRSAAADGIAHASYRGERGSPVLFAPRFREELLSLRGSEGGRVLIARHPQHCVAVELDPERGRDVDRPGDLR